MLRLNSERGFTLVELAIVMTIIGLLIGGILKGQTLMQNARVTAEVAEVKAISAAQTTFKDMFNAVPGDMLNAGTRLVGCPTAAACNPATTVVPGAGDGIVGLPTYFANGTAVPAALGLTATTTAPALVAAETYLYWSHMLLANLIGNVTTAGLSVATTFAFGVTHPDVKLGGGFQVAHDAGYAQPGNSTGTAGSLTGLTGTVVAQITGNELQTGTWVLTQGNNILTPQQAAQIDLKMDDGQPATGYVQAFGLQTSCYSSVAPGTTAAPVYLTSITTTDCGLLFRVEN